MSIEESKELSDRDRYFIENYAREISNFSDDKFKQFVSSVIEARMSLSKLAKFLHPDNGNSSDSFDYLFSNPLNTLTQLARRAQEIRKKRDL